MFQEFCGHMILSLLKDSFPESPVILTVYFYDLGFNENMKDL